MLGRMPLPGYRVVPMPGPAEMFLADRPDTEELRARMLQAR
jgi:hypothetical protein